MASFGRQQILQNQNNPQPEPEIKIFDEKREAKVLNNSPDIIREIQLLNKIIYRKQQNREDNNVVIDNNIEILLKFISQLQTIYDSLLKEKQDTETSIKQIEEQITKSKDNDPKYQIELTKKESFINTINTNINIINMIITQLKEINPSKRDAVFESITKLQQKLMNLPPPPTSLATSALPPFQKTI